MRIVIVTDAWTPQINGVVRTLSTTAETLRSWGHEVEVISPDRFATVPCPGYPEIRLATNPWRMRRLIEAAEPDTVHVATEGPLGLAARLALKRLGWAYTTSYHTDFPAYLQAFARIPPALTYRFLRWFHGAAARTLVTTAAVRDHLAAKGFVSLVVWSRGVDTRQFYRSTSVERTPSGYPQPVWLSVGRLSVEKNLPAFLSLDLPGTKIVVGDGPVRGELERRFPDAVFAGAHRGDALADFYRMADVFVFPSRSDTFGLVQIEAMACGTPVAAYPGTLSAEVVTDAVTGALDDDLQTACTRAWHETDRQTCADAAARTYSWHSVTTTFLNTLVPITA